MDTLHETYMYFFMHVTHNWVILEQKMYCDFFGLAWKYLFSKHFITELLAYNHQQMV